MKHLNAFRNSVGSNVPALRFIPCRCQDRHEPALYALSMRRCQYLQGTRHGLGNRPMLTYYRAAN